MQQADTAQGRATVVNSRGLHARPCHALVRIALGFAGEVNVSCEGRSADAKSILELMTLSAGQGCVLEFTARGAEGEELVRSLVGLVESGFQETD